MKQVNFHATADTPAISNYWYWSCDKKPDLEGNYHPHSVWS